MDLRKETTVDRIEYLPEQNCLQIREITRVYEGDAVLSSTYGRYVLRAETDVSTITDEGILKALSLLVR